MPSARKCATAPSPLTQNEIADPQQVIDDLFDFAHLPDIRELLWEWLKATVTGTYHKELSRTERAAILSLYEHLTRLVEAAHIMHTTEQKSKGNKSRKRRKAQKKL